MTNPFDKHQFATQPDYSLNRVKFEARKQIIDIYRQITQEPSIPANKDYWTLCNKQPNHKGSEIVQLIDAGLIKKSQFFGVDYDLKNEGIIEFNKREHPEANWFQGDWIQVIEDNFDLFCPALVHFDYTRTILKKACHRYVARTMDMCPSGAIMIANLMLSDGHSSRRFDPKQFVSSVCKFLLNKNDWEYSETFYPYKSSRTDMGSFVFIRK